VFEGEDYGKQRELNRIAVMKALQENRSKRVNPHERNERNERKQKEYVSVVAKYESFRFCDNVDRLYELQERKSRFEWSQRTGEPLEGSEELTEAEQAELAALADCNQTRTGLTHTKGLYTKFWSCIERFGRHRLELYVEELPQASVSNLQEYAKLIWSAVGLSGQEKQLRKVEAREYDHAKDALESFVVRTFECSSISCLEGSAHLSKRFRWHSTVGSTAMLESTRSIN